MRQCPECSNVADDDVANCPRDGAELLPPDALLGRTVDGKYHIESLLGAGGQGAVREALEAILRARRVVTILPLFTTRART